MRFMAILALIALAGCATRQPVWQDRQRTINIPIGEARGLSGEAALQHLLAKSARITVDHGYRYFTIIKPAPAAEHPSGDATIRLFRNDEIRYPAPGVWDAYSLLAGHAPKPGPG